MASRRKQRIGIFDGTFSPPHYGHLIGAEKTRQAFQLDSVEFVVSADPPNKTNVLNAEDRFDMVVAATEDNPSFNASRIAIDYNRGSGYSLQSVEAIHSRCKGKAELFFLLSAEYLDPDYKWWLAKWVGGKELFKLVTFLVFPRDTMDVDKARVWAKLIPQARIEVLDAPSPPMSSTLIRDLTATGKSIWYTTPWPVQQLIAKRRYFGAGQTILSPSQLAPTANVKRVAIFPGQFDPIHYGDLLFAEWARQEYQQDRVLFIPSGNPVGHSEIQYSADSRYRMVVAATAENPFFDASRLDIGRKTKSYALLSAEDVQRTCGAGVQLDLLINSDYLEPAHENYLPRWMGFEKLLQMVRFIVKPKVGATVEEVRALTRLIPDATFEVPHAPVLPITSAEIRGLVAAGKSIRYMTPFVVQQGIAKTGLYKHAR
jgi:nicotinate-nucleotide adenylyltransferase